MTDLPGKIRVQDAALANMVTIAAVLEYLDQKDPGCKEAIEARARDIALNIKKSMDEDSGAVPSDGEENGE